MRSDAEEFEKSAPQFYLFSGDPEPPYRSAQYPSAVCGKITRPGPRC